MNKIFSFWRFVVSVGWAKSLTWAVATEKEQRIYLFSVHLIERDNSKALSLIILPVAITIGLVI